MDVLHEAPKIGAPWCAYAVTLPEASASPDRIAETARTLGFGAILLLGASPDDPAWEAACDAAPFTDLARAAHARGIGLYVTLCLGEVASHHKLAGSAFSIPPASETAVVDPRRPVVRAAGTLALRRPTDAGLLAWWRQRLVALASLGIDGFVQLDPSIAAISLASALAEADGPPMRALRTKSNDAAQPETGLLIAAGQSLPQVRAAVAHTVLAEDAWALQAGLETGIEPLVHCANSAIAGRESAARTAPRAWNATPDVLSIMSRATESGALVTVQNRGAAPVGWPPANLPAMPWQDFAPAAPGMAVPAMIAPGEVIVLRARALPPVASSLPHAASAAAAAAAPRIIIGGLTPAVDEGRYPVKCVIGDPIDITADIFADGHEQLAAAILVRAADAPHWVRHPMRAAPNDVWTATIALPRLGRHEMCVEAWLDEWGGFTRDLARKQEAGQDLSLEFREADAMLAAALDHASPDVAVTIAAALTGLRAAAPGVQATLLLAAPLAAAMRAADIRPFVATSFTQPIDVEREAARFSSWYELFPRSQSNRPGEHGNFADVVARLPHIAAMGFDTLYFPPIHPIGAVNRKGRNNTLTPAPDDVGSPYAIGAVAGGHDAIHAELGTLADFRALVAAAHSHGMEIALDFAIQCAPDHPWLTQHPGWFAWRPDGSIKYAENPPKKYQDIVNVAFYAPEAVPDLWHALRDVVLFWIAQGIQVFRVDNPHTKPLPFWEWLIADVKSRCPQAIFLSEAFTRPKPMYHLAKVGFSQSYSYFTWRNDKAELTAYLTELTQTPVRDFFRPHFFVNTPDINPYFLQTSGRPGFLIRAALAATLSGLFGVYSGFELCEAAPLPGREEYLNSEKYEIRQRPARAPGDIVDEITTLNRVRRAEPALQTHLGVQFHNAFNDRILYYSKATPGAAYRILIAVSLDPFAPQEADFEVPLWLFGLPDHAGVDVTDLLGGAALQWYGKFQHMRLTPHNPYRIWRIIPRPQD